MIVIPMAGLSSRFRKSGFKVPKYMLAAKGKSLFKHAVGSFEKYFNSEHFVFIALDILDTKNFIIEECKEMGLKDYSISILKKPTRGQAETVFLGLQEIASIHSSLTIFNIDTFRPGFSYPESLLEVPMDGYLEVFRGSGKNWSYVKPVGSGADSFGIVTETAEKVEISNLCCSGLYYFKRFSDFKSLYQLYQAKDNTELQGGELYIAPMYNEMIKNGAKIYYQAIDRTEIIFCGVPDEYEDFICLGRKC